MELMVHKVPIKRSGIFEMEVIFVNKELLTCSFAVLVEKNNFIKSSLLIETEM